MIPDVLIHVNIYTLSFYFCFCLFFLFIFFYLSTLLHVLLDSVFNYEMITLIFFLPADFTFSLQVFLKFLVRTSKLLVNVVKYIVLNYNDMVFVTTA